MTSSSVVHQFYFLQFYACRMNIINHCFSRRTIEDIISTLVSLEDGWSFDVFSFYLW